MFFPKFNSHRFFLKFNSHRFFPKFNSHRFFPKFNSHQFFLKFNSHRFFLKFNSHRFFPISCPKPTDSTNFPLFRSLSSINSSRSPSPLFSHHPFPNFRLRPQIRTFHSKPQSPEFPENSTPDFPESGSSDLAETPSPRIFQKSSEAPELLQPHGKATVVLPEGKSSTTYYKSGSVLQFLSYLFSSKHPNELPNTHKTYSPVLSKNSPKLFEKASHELGYSSDSVLPFMISLFSSKPPEELQGAVRPWESPVLIVVSGPSGSGKSSVVRKLTEMRNDLRRIVSVTSREKRAGEVEGRDYVFVTKEDFLCMVDRGELLEYSMVYGSYKGIPKYKIREHLAAGDDVVVMVDVQGAAKLRLAYGRAAVFIFVVAESEGAAAERLVNRNTESSDGLLVRMKAANEEVVHVRFFDYVVVNVTDHLSAAVALVNSIISTEKAKLLRGRTVRLLSRVSVGSTIS